jgi:hypothetical protein
MVVVVVIGAMDLIICELTRGRHYSGRLFPAGHPSSGYQVLRIDCPKREWWEERRATERRCNGVHTQDPSRIYHSGSGLFVRGEGSDGREEQRDRCEHWYQGVGCRPGCQGMPLFLLWGDLCVVCVCACVCSVCGGCGSCSVSLQHELKQLHCQEEWSGQCFLQPARGDDWTPVLRPTESCSPHRRWPSCADLMPSSGSHLFPFKDRFRRWVSAHSETRRCSAALSAARVRWILMDRSNVYDDAKRSRSMR